MKTIPLLDPPLLLVSLRKFGGFDKFGPGAICRLIATSIHDSSTPAFWPPFSTWGLGLDEVLTAEVYCFADRNVDEILIFVLRSSYLHFAVSGRSWAHETVC